MRTYTTLDDRVIDISELTASEAAYLARCYAAYRDGLDWFAFRELVAGAENPLLGPDAVITRAVYAHPLFGAIRDLEDRVGILQGRLQASGEDITRDPLNDQFVPVAEAGQQKGVSLRAVYGAIERGDLVASHERPVRVSANSLAHWDVSAVRQKAGRARQTSRA